MADLRLSKTDAARVQRLLSMPRPCLLCGSARTTVQALYQPDKPEQWGGKPGKVRLLGYALCRRCYTLPAETRNLAVEGRIMRNLIGDRN